MAGLPPFLNMRFAVKVLIASILSVCVCQVSVILAAEKEQTEQQLQQIKQQIKQLQQRLDNKRQEYSSVTRSLRSTEKKINSAAKIVRATRSQIAREKQTLKNNKKQELQLERNKRKHQDILAHQIRSAYSSGRQEYLKLLLNQEQPEKLGRMFSYYDYLNKARTKSIKELGETLIQLTQVQKDIQANIKELALLEQAQVKEQKRLLSLKEQRKKEVKQLAASIASQDKKLSHLRENEEELESLLRQMQKALEEIFQQQNRIFMPFRSLRSTREKYSNDRNESLQSNWS